MKTASNGGRFFTVLGRTEADQANAKMIEEYLRTKLDDLNFEEKFSLFLKQAIVTGNSIAAVPWKRTVRRQPVVTPVEVLGVTVGTKTIETDVLIYEGPDFEVLDLFDVVIDPIVPNFEEAMLIRRLQRSLHELRNAGIYSRLDEVEQSLSRTKETTLERKRKAMVSTVDNNELAPLTVTLYEAWGTFELEGELYRDYVATVTQEGLLIRFESCGFSGKPFVMTNFIQVPNEVYGLGAIEKSLGLQQAINTLTNQKLDVISISINNPFTYLINDDVFNPETVVTRPGALIPVKSHETLKPIQYLNNFTVAFEEIADLKTEVQEATGAFKYLAGSISGGEGSLNGRTATEVSALIQGGSQKYSSLLSHLEQTALEPFLRMAFGHCQHFAQGDTDTLRMVQTDGSTIFSQIPLQVMRTAQCQFRISGARSAFVKGQELGQLATFIDLVKTAPPEIAEQVNLLELYKRVYRRLGFQDEQDIFSPSTTQPTQPPQG